MQPDPPVVGRGLARRGRLEPRPLRWFAERPSAQRNLAERRPPPAHHAAGAKSMLHLVEPEPRVPAARAPAHRPMYE